jgi:hypothetical protein
MLVSNAIANEGFTPFKYFMINAAVSIEAYDAAVVDNEVVMKTNMTEASWADYPEKLMAANWHELPFTETDARKGFTWRGIFTDVLPYAYNFYSPGDEVVENANPGEWFDGSLWTAIWGLDFARHAWVMQEIGKGCNGLTSWIAFECSGGWGFNNYSPDENYIGDCNPDTGECSIYSATGASDALATAEITDDELAQYGFFRKLSHFNLDEAGYSYLYEPLSTTVSLADETHKWDILASAIPAMSFAAAANPMGILDERPSGGINRNFNMQALRGGDLAPWPDSRLENNDLLRDWVHSDIRDVALPFVYHTYEKMLELGEPE